MADILSTQQNFRALSMKDLLQARDLYHYHLLNKPNCVGTAVGLYLIREGDPQPEEQRELCRREGKERYLRRPKPERTLQNSEVRDYSWPCVLAFVTDWVSRNEFGGSGRLRPEDSIPKTLYLPDGRMVPVCIVKVEQGAPDPTRLPNWLWPSRLFGGGMPIIVNTQAQEHRATAGCLVSDGHTTYLLTSRHVCGSEGEPVFTLSAGERVQIGVASNNHLSRLEFAEVYPEFVGRRTYVNLDVGLIELADLNDWTSQTFGLGPSGALADLNELNITTRLIDAPVIASGAASGRLEGRIKALFYRYKSVGGYDYVSDFLIAPRQSEDEREIPQTQPGDSGAVWHLVTKQKRTRDDEGYREDDDFEGELRPLAIEWGGQVFIDSGNKSAFGLATSLTTVCRQLNVELVAEHNTGVLPYWGQMGHYSIATFAAKALPAGKLRTFIRDNVEQISFAIGNLDPKTIKELIKAAKEGDGIVPLADVPDLIWKNHKTKVRGGRDDRWVGSNGHFRPAGPEHPTHYADIDEEGPNGKTLLQLCIQNSNNVSVNFWQQFYDEMGHTEQRDRGLLPFRVWQFFDAMKNFAAAGEPDKFLCAAGLLSHYVGDACQPLHGSIYADGYSDIPTTIIHHRRDTGEEYTEESHLGAGVHSTYETKMVDRYAEELVDGIQLSIAQPPAQPIPQIQTGKDAAIATIALMNRSAKRIPPKKLVDAFLDAGGKTTVAVQDALFEDFGQKTIDTMTDGARVLARLWEGAWKKGNGNAIPTNELGMIDPDVLKPLYENLKFVESVDLDHIEPFLE